MRLLRDALPGFILAVIAEMARIQAAIIAIHAASGSAGLHALPVPQPAPVGP